MVYVFMAVLQDEHVQKKGFCSVVYLLKHENQPGGFHFGIGAKFAQYREALPFRSTGFHFCVNDFAARALISFVRACNAMPKLDRDRMRVHNGTSF